MCGSVERTYLIMHFEIICLISQEDKSTAGTDGTLFGNRMFTCEMGRALFVKLSSVKPDSRFPSQMETFSKRQRLTSQGMYVCIIIDFFENRCKYIRNF